MLLKLKCDLFFVRILLLIAGYCLHTLSIRLHGDRVSFEVYVPFTYLFRMTKSSVVAQCSLQFCYLDDIK